MCLKGITIIIIDLKVEGRATSIILHGSTSKHIRNKVTCFAKIKNVARVKVKNPTSELQYKP